jgi:hypothetical protein
MEADASVDVLARAAWLAVKMCMDSLLVATFVG